MSIQRTLTSAIAAAVLSVAVSAAAQPPSQTSGPLIVERIQHGWIVSPDARATDLGGETGALAGGYLGRITDNSWVIGAGGYFLTNRDEDFKLAYGGPVVEWLVRSDRRIGFGIRTLVGAGSATLPLPVTDLVDERILAAARHVSTGRGRGLNIVDPSALIAVRDDFFVAEPQVNLLLNLSRGQRIVFGVGYRAVGSAPLLGDAVNGLSGSIAYQIGGGK
jgi:hypothetical protein